MATEIKTLVVDRPGETTSRPTVVLMRPIVAVLVRVARTYGQSVLALLAVYGVGDATLAGGIAPDAFGAALWKAATYSLAVAVVTLIWNFLELLNRLDETAPELRG